MALGIDIYRYQIVDDWNEVKRHGVSFVYVKGTDGDGPALVRADNQVRGAQSVSLPAGLYHYAQLSPSPEVQADILTAEVLRLDATGLPPALDLEDPHKPGGAARDFAQRFLNRLRYNGFDSITLYANTSMLNGIVLAGGLDVPGLVIWAANYGPNDGVRHPLPKPWNTLAHIHQYTSTALVPGIRGRVDLNESLTEIPGVDMALTQEDVNRVATAVWELHRPHLDPSVDTILPMWIWTVGANMGAWAAANRPIPVPPAGEIVDGLMTTLVPVLVAELLKQLPEGMDEERARDIARMTVQNIADRLVDGQAQALTAARGGDTPID
jgi:GH25 family lysozyme M1 (1,4-beta-N-acetylmuramidase)